jgi:hypothetical protein
MIDRISKIQALADDERGHPEVRQRAKEWLRAHHVKPPPPKFHDVKPTPVVHGMRRDPTYEYYVFTDLSLWDRTKSGNRTYVVAHKGINYRIVLFQHKKSPTWGWMRATDGAEPVFSGRFSTITEAQADSWADLMAI